MRSPRTRFVTALTGCALLTACSGGGTTDTKVDASLFFEGVAQLREAHVAVSGEPKTLVEALPTSDDSNSKTSVEESSTSQWSDLALIGEVIDVEPGYGIHYPNSDPGYGGDEEAGAEVIDYDDPRAQERVVLVTIQPEWTAGAHPGEAVTLTLGANTDVDPSQFVESITSLGHVVAVLAERRTGRNAGEYYPILNGALLGTVEADGSLDFPGLGDQEDAFVGDLDTADELKAAS